MNHSHASLELWKPFEIPGKVELLEDADGFIKVLVETTVSHAEIYLQGAHVTSFQKKGEDSIFFMSSSGRMPRGAMLHGGVPICFPWFARREGEALDHGVARIHLWNLVETKALATGEVQLLFHFPSSLLQEAGWLAVDLFYRVTVGEQLRLELSVHNSTSEKFFYEECLHSYFLVGDVKEVTIHGLRGLHYLDKTENFRSKLETADEIPILGETNRVYLDSTAAIEVHDHAKKRTIRIEKNNSRSTVLWNPWHENAKTIPDFAPEDYLQMVCVESGNVKEYAKQLAPGESSSFEVTFRVESQQ